MKEKIDFDSVHIPSEVMLDQRSGFPKFPWIRANRCESCNKIDIMSYKFENYICSRCV